MHIQVKYLVHKVTVKRNKLSRSECLCIMDTDMVVLMGAVVLHTQQLVVELALVLEDSR